ncbi:MAG: patatin-like phospholipase family protein [Bacteroidota bacterium]
MFVVSLQGYSQKVGLVLSGGGARGFAQIGVLRALEENKIPIDYITGVSSGALIGCYYATGTSPSQLERLVTQKIFAKRAEGQFDEDNLYSFLKNPVDASWIEIKLFSDSVFRTQLPSNVVNAAEIDFALMENLAVPISRAGNNFDSLLIPFRCVASDITAKRAVVYHQGDLAFAVRASMSFPFYYAPLLDKNHILYDGGIYNNFPADVLESEFNPDIIIGVNTADTIDRPSEVNFLSQLKSMIQRSTNYSMNRAQDIIITPNVSNIGLFSFDDIRAAIDSGYAMGLRMIPEIKSKLGNREADTVALAEKRKHFSFSNSDLLIDSIVVTGVNTKQADYIRQTINPKDKLISADELKNRWFRLIADENLRYIFPTLIFNPTTGHFILSVDVRKNKGLSINFGGNVSSRPINTGFISVQRNYWDKYSIRTFASIYFGKLYSSGHIRSRLDVPGTLPFYIEPSITLNQWDFYKSSSAFIEDVKPSYLIQYDEAFNIKLGTPLTNKLKLEGGANIFETKDKYYLVRDFTQADTSDLTDFKGSSYFLELEQNTLNRKMYATTGSGLVARLRYIKGDEKTFPGSTGILRDTTTYYHEWFQMNLKYESYFNSLRKFKWGVFGELMLSGQPFFSNYRATVLAAPAFNPIADMQTQFQETYRAHNYLGVGIKNLISINDNFDVRLEGYAFQPFREILQEENYKARYGDNFSKRYFVATFNTIYKSPIGPVSLALNYYDKRDNPVGVIFHIGYIIFNRKAIY